MAQEQKLSGPDLSQGISLGEIPEGGSLLGHAGGESVLVVREGGEVFAIGATCSHYGGPLAEGLVCDGEVRCPWHHAAFSLRTGEAVRAPALNPVACWEVERRGDRIQLGAKRAVTPRPAVAGPASVLIVGAGAAGNAAAETLRGEGYAGPIVVVGADPSVPVDRPNLSKDYLAGTAPEEWMPLRDREFYERLGIELLLGTRVTRIDPRARQVTLSDGTTRDYGALLLATGADPVKLSVPGADLPHVHTLRSIADSRAIIAAARDARTAIVVGASFIGLEVAASLRTRGLAVHVVAPEARPMERVLGPQIGDFVRALHEEHGVNFHLGATLAAIAADEVTLLSGARLTADLVVAGVGVRPATALAEEAGLRVERGVLVDAFLESSAPGIYAAGDIARWPDPRSDAPIRVEHWVVAQRQGRAAARNILGRKQPFDAVPFFWSQHYDVAINYVGHAEAWDEIRIAGRIEDRDCLVAWSRGGQILAVATIGRDAESLRAEVAFEHRDQAALHALLD